MAEPGHPTRRWGEARALLDDDEARRLLLEAAARCIVRRGDAHVRMGEVADEAGVARSTVYRYFASRDDLILGLLLNRVDLALEAIAHSLPHPGDAIRSIPELVLRPLALVEGNALNEALFSPASRSDVTYLELSAEGLVDAAVRQYGALLERWQADGQLHGDLDVRETLRWMNAVALVLLAPPWRERSTAAKRDFLDRYLVRALVVPVGPERR
jgi:TetR/AcrR family transcriptional regulator